LNSPRAKYSAKWWRDQQSSEPPSRRRVEDHLRRRTASRNCPDPADAILAADVNRRYPNFFRHLEALRTLRMAASDTRSPAPTRSRMRSRIRCSCRRVRR
jgi:hypothetical protein